MQQFIQTTLNDWNKERQNEIELAAATASILPENTEDINVSLQTKLFLI